MKLKSLFVKIENQPLMLFFLFLLSAFIVKIVPVFFVPYLSVSGGVDYFFFIEGARVMDSGGVLYKNFGEIKPPGVFLLVYLLLKIFGENHVITAIQLSGVLFQALTAFFLCKTGRLLYSQREGVWMGLAFIVFSSIDYYFWSLNTMLLALFPLSAALYFLFSYGRKARTIFLVSSGFCLSCAVLLSTNLIVYAPLFPVYLLLTKEGWLNTAKKSLAAVAGFLIPAGLVLLYLVLNGALSDFIWWNFDWAKIYGGVYPLPRRLWAFISGFYELWFWLPLYVLIFLYYRNKTREPYFRSNENLLMTLVLVAALISRLLLSKGQHRYYLFLLPVFILLAGYALQSPLKNYLRAGFAAVITAGFIYAHAVGFSRDYGPVIDGRKELYELIRKETAENDKIYVWYEGYEIYLKSGRSSTTSFFSSSQHLDCDEKWRTNGCLKIDIPWKKFMAEFREEKPALIVDMRPNFRGDYSEIKCIELAGYVREFKNYVEQNYTMFRMMKIPGLYKDINEITLWKLKK